MNIWKLRKFAADVVHDMRSRNLLPIAIVLVIAILAVPFLMPRSSSDEPEAAKAAPVNASKLAPENQAAVLAYSPGVRDYKERLKELSTKNPFRQQFTDPVEAAADAIESGSVEVSSGEITPTGGGATGDSGSTGGGGGSKKKPKVKTTTETKYVFYETDVMVGEVGTPLVRRNGLQQFDMLPSEQAPVLVFLGVTGGGKQATFLVSKDVTGVGGAGTCYPDPASCQLLGISLGGAAELAYSIDGKTYRVEVANIKRRTSSTPPG